MKINGRELFTTPEVDNYIAKFEEKLAECDNKINQIKADISKCQNEEDACLTVDILEGTAGSKKDLSNCQARKANLQSQLDTEIKRAMKIKEIMANGLVELMAEANKQLKADMQTFNDTVEKEIYFRLSELRKQQEELLLGLQVAHNDVVSRLISFDDLCTLFDFPQYKRSATNQLFHNNLYMAHSSFPEFGSAVLNCNSLQAVEDRIMRARADANAQYNRGKAHEDMAQLPQAMTLKDVDLEAFIDSLIKK